MKIIQQNIIQHYLNLKTKFEMHEIAVAVYLSMCLGTLNIAVIK